MTDIERMIYIARRMAEASGIDDPSVMVYQGEPKKIRGGYYIPDGQPVQEWTVFMNDARIAFRIARELEENS